MPRPPVPEPLAAWQPLADLARAIEDAGLKQIAVERPRGMYQPDVEWRPFAAGLALALEDARTWPHKLTPTEWRLVSWLVPDGPARPDVNVELKLEGRAQTEDLFVATVSNVFTFVFARRGPPL
ncbi:hypothetical protein [Rubrivirga sp.]|uniref:hypothetical protein n=1 Tax=Rubrivirga sp. TaxID=1885344 RepID=UPI003C79156C